MIPQVMKILPSFHSLPPSLLPSLLPSLYGQGTNHSHAAAPSFPPPRAISVVQRAMLLEERRLSERAGGPGALHKPQCAHCAAPLGLLGVHGVCVSLFQGGGYRLGPRHQLW